MLEALLLMLFSSLVAMVPPLSAPVTCRRCCDPIGPAEGSGDQRAMPEFSHIPEVHTFINMTILKDGGFNTSVDGRRNGTGDWNKPPTAKKPRLCGNCHMPGHTRVTCPQR